jgi:hypothetical protein
MAAWCINFSVFPQLASLRKPTLIVRVFDVMPYGGGVHLSYKHEKGHESRRCRALRRAGIEYECKTDQKLAIPSATADHWRDVNIFLQPQK